MDAQPRQASSLQIVNVSEADVVHVIASNRECCRCCAQEHARARQAVVDPANVHDFRSIHLPLS